MPLRSVEAATRDDAIAAARDQFGPQARIVGVRRVRSGGVLGFFATERYVAEVAELAPESTVRPAVPSRDRDDDGLPADFSSPLASASPARARAAAPSRNGAAAWAAEAAARSTDDVPEAARLAAAAARAARTSAAPARPAPVSRPADDDRVSELAGLLAAAQPEAPALARTAPARASFPRAGTVARTGDHLVDDAVDDVLDEPAAPLRGGGPGLPPAAPAAPSPFTAALARMVAGDQDVRQAVQDALAPPAEKRPRDDAEPWPARSEPVRTAETAVPSPQARQEEEPVGIQVIAPPSTIDRDLELPTWAAEPEAAPASVSSREEAIADLLRGALAQGHSDEALAGILRKVLAGASPQTALPESEPAVPAGPVFAVPTLPVPPLGDLHEVQVPEVQVPEVQAPEVQAPEVQAPEVQAPDVPDAPVAVALPTMPLAELPAVEPTPSAPVTDFSAAPVPEPAITPAAPITPAPLITPATSHSMWGTPATSSLWGDAVPSTPCVEKDAPIWGDVAGIEAPSLFAAPAPTPASAEIDVAEVAEVPAAEAPVVDEPMVDAPVQEVSAPDAEVDEPAVEETLDEAEGAELAPVLARTASDPAPMMSLDATTVMPPLSLLPPLPGSRGRGRPPVPPVAARPSMTSSVPAAVPELAAELEAEGELADPTVVAVAAPAEDAVSAPAPVTLATVTRLPVAPLTADPGLPEDLDEVDAETPLFAPTPRKAPPAPAAVPPGDVASRLQLLGLPAELLGSTFAADVAERGTYAALTRSLALQLPPAPALPGGSGQAVFVVGPGVDALRAARSLAAALHLDPDCVQWATRGDLAGLAPRSSRVTSVESAIDRRQECAATGTVTIVAVDAPLRSDASWMAQMTSVWAPAAVWAVVEATRKPEDVEPWLEGLPRVDALIVQDTDLSADPAAVLRRVHTPVALLDGVRATPHRWASLLCERLESATT